MAQTIILNMIPNGIPDVAYVSQYDVGRELIFKLYEGASVYTIPADVSVVIGGKKGDAHVFAYNATIAQDRHSVSIATTEQMTACAGENLCQLRISKTGIDIATVNFRMIVQERPDASGDPSETDIPAIVELAQQEVYDAEAWAKGTKNGTDVTSSDPQYNNHAKYWAGVAEQWAEQFVNGVVYKGSVLFENIPTSDMLNGWMYNITDAFTTDERFSEGSGIYCEAGTNIIWSETLSKWDLAGGFGGVQSFNGRHGNITPAANDYTAAQVSANITVDGSAKTNVADALSGINTIAASNKANIADAFDATRTSLNAYQIGDVCIYNNILYRFINSHYGAWNASDVEQITVGDQIANYKDVIITVPVSEWSNSQTDGYYTATINTPEFNTAMPPKITCAGASVTESPTDAQMAAYRNIQNPNGYIEQISATSIKLYAKVKPTDTFYIKLSGYGIGVQIDSCQNATVANQVQSSLYLATSGSTGGAGQNYNGSDGLSLYFRKRIYSISASNWSSSANSDGYYTYTLTGSGTHNNFDTNYTPFIYCAGSNYSTRPTAAQISAYRNICEPNGYVEQTNAYTFKLYAKTKPTETFYIMIEGINII